MSYNYINQNNFLNRLFTYPSIFLIIVIFLVIISGLFIPKPRAKSSVPIQVRFNKESIALNNKAMNIYTLMLRTGDSDTNIIAGVIKLLDSAISLDSSYHIAYSNKATIQWELNHNSAAIITLKKGMEKDTTWSGGADAIGLMYEFLGEYAEAIKYYETALHLIRKRFPNNRFPNNQNKSSVIRYGYRINEIILLMLLKREKEAKIILDNLPKEFPDELEYINEFRDEMLNFDRMNYVNMFNNQSE